MANIFGSREKAQTVSPVTRMPVPSDQNRYAAAETRRRVSGRRGRTSTIMTRRGEAGTNAYANSLLGQAG